MSSRHLEPAGSLVGLLQRGRGAGHLAALQADRTAAHEAVLRCVCPDEQWLAGTFDDRDEYYARLGLAIGLPLEPIRAFIRDRSAGSARNDDIEMACRVLGEMAKRGSVDAASVLTGEVGEGPGWFWAIEVLADVDYTLAHTSELSHRHPIVDAALLDALSSRLEKSKWAGDPPWGAFRAYPRLRWMAAEDESAGVPRRREQPDVADWAVEDLRAAALGATHTPEALAAARALGVLGDLGVLDTLVAHLEADSGSRKDPYRRRVGEYVVALPPEHSLPLARRWLHERFPLSMIADRIFEARAEPTDRVAIERAVLDALAGDSHYRVWTLGGALKRIRDRRSAATMRVVFEESPYALARREALEGLIAMAPVDSEDLIVEALWDCDFGCRRLASASVPLSDRTRARLQEIRFDPLGEEDCREAAAGRLT